MTLLTESALAFTRPLRHLLLKCVRVCVNVCVCVQKPGTTLLMSVTLIIHMCDIGLF